MAIVIGGLGPWATAFGAFSVNGTAGDGTVFVVLGLIAAVLWMARPPVGRVRRVFMRICGALVVLVGIVDGISIATSELHSLSWGICVGIVGGIALIVFSAQADTRPTAS